MASSSLLEDISMERVKHLIKQVEGVFPAVQELKDLTDERRKALQEQIASYALSVRTTKLDPEQLKDFFNRPYHLMPVKEKERGAPGEVQSYYLILPRFIDAQFGWLHQQTPSFNVFLINRYVDWLGDLPQEIKKQLGWKAPPQLLLEGELLRGAPEALKHAWDKYRPMLRHQDEKGITINSKKTFELIAALVKDGVLPFTPKPVPMDEVHNAEVDFELRKYQKEAWAVFLQYGNIGVFFPASVGKTYLGMWAMSCLNGPHLVVVPSLILKEQWEERIQLHTKLVLGKDVFVTTYYGAIKKHGGTQWSLMIVDEAHHLPANEFSKLALLKKKYIMGLSATPQREDGREHFIFALTGKPVGLGWEHFRQIGIISSPICHIWILKNLTEKLSLLRKKLLEYKKTIIFCDSIELGKQIAEKQGIPHVHGTTHEGRLKIIDEALQKEPYAVVVSRVGDEGLSLPEIERVIEVSWLFGSRRQELQRFTRLLHGEKEGEHHILMTLEEYALDKKRLFSIMDKGFKLELHREGVSDEAISKRLSTQERMPRIRQVKEVRDQSLIQVTPSAGPGAPDTAIIGLPGIQKQLSRMNSGQRKVAEYLLQHDGTWFKKASFPDMFGYVSMHSFDNTTNLGRLVDSGLLERKHEGGAVYFRSNKRGSP